MTQIVPLAQALNVSTDALFGFAAESYDHKLADEVWFEATKLRDSGEPSQGALAAVEFLDQKCEENIFNYGILTRFVQSIAHMSRFVNQHNTYYKALLGAFHNGSVYGKRQDEGSLSGLLSRYGEVLGGCVSAK